VLGELWNAARARRSLGCRALGSDMLLRVGEVAYYPDVQLVCDPTDRHERYTERPCVVVEVVSPSTLRRDYGEKLGAYQTIPTLQAYLLISQNERRVLRWWRGALGAWSSEEIRHGAVSVPCLDLDLVLEVIYADLP
jgi:Uma2 family endonuclease